jgi:hypothetical protein
VEAAKVLTTLEVEEEEEALKFFLSYVIAKYG